MEEYGTLGNIVIKVVGVGGGGGNAVNNMIAHGLTGVEFIAANTDKQVLDKNLAQKKINLGIHRTKGLGAGGNPEIGRGAAVEDVENITEILRGADIVFVTAGLGGGTGTGAAPVISAIAKDLGALTIAVVSTPFSWEGKQRADNAKKGLEELKERVDSYIVVANDRIKDVMEREITFKEAFLRADDVLRQGVQSIADTISGVGYINVDFADMRSIMGSQGPAIMGIGTAKGENRDIAALDKAIRGPLLADVNLRGVHGILLNIIVGEDLRMDEVTRIGNKVSELVGDDVKTFVGVNLDGRIDGSLSVVLIATGIKSRPPQSARTTAAYQPNIEAAPFKMPEPPKSISYWNSGIEVLDQFPGDRYRDKRFNVDPWEGEND
ncbi:MAG: cell division protein FtsZ [Deferribacteraceae bacterium]|jgi:cell division protein FtsZ|nr:cell division protein FtsZ [Deferribacteraceae bacterium]